MKKLLGFNDFFRDGNPSTMEMYANQVGKKDIRSLSCLMLSYCKPRFQIPTLQLLQKWFTYKDKDWTGSVGYSFVESEWRRIVNTNEHNRFTILCEESLLMMYTWTVGNDEIVEDNQDGTGSFMIPLFKLLLLFNDDVLRNFKRADDSAKRHNTLINYRKILAQRFPQCDLVNIDFGKIVVTQLHKSMKFLAFLEADEKYRKLLKRLLQDFNCESSQVFFKALGGAVLLPLKGDSPNINSLIIDDSEDSKRSKFFLEKLAFEVSNAPDSIDYKFLRDCPLELLPNSYRVVFDLFLIKKLYNGLVFKLSTYHTEDPTLFQYNFLSSVKSEFSEEVLLYDTMEKIFSYASCVSLDGKSFKKAGLEREPDFYVRMNNSIMIFESKDFFMKASEKLSYDFDIIMEGLKEKNRLGKAVMQCAVNIKRILLKEMVIDEDYNPTLMEIFPVIVVHDSLYNADSLNFWVNEMFNIELNKQKGSSKLDFSKVMAVTLLDIDTLILYQAKFERRELDLFDCVSFYQKTVEFNSSKGDQIDSNTIMSFSEFMREGVGNPNVTTDFDNNIFDLYRKGGYETM
ncbi:hypothetical protein [Agriterribacter sp.]|uniref:hypothetical protein n=1 Tax=Agriterribacter sp. TaxID=2821509 RepID=UPI002CE9D810|nr:hypothetical protein [Agriterribacter sp.]HTN05707.1 hypothetical protein [Agriterribacter sp.]